MSWKRRFPSQNCYFETKQGILYNRDVMEILKTLPDESIDCVITSPPYWALRDYGIEGQIGLEPTFEEYLEKLWKIFDEIYRILKPTGTVFVNLGDTYYGGGKGKTNGINKAGAIGGEKFRKMKYPFKSLCMIPSRFAIRMIERGWILRNEIIWHKPNAMPQSMKDRFTVDFEKIFFFVKKKKYYFNQIKEPNKDKYEGKRGYTIRRTKLQSAMRSTGFQNYYGKGRNKRTVWSIPTKPFKGAHFAVFPPDIPEICIRSGCPKDGIVLDPFMGSGTTAIVAEKLNRRWIGIELNPEYCEIAKRRIIEVIHSEASFNKLF